MAAKCRLCGDEGVRSKAWVVCEPCTEALLNKVKATTERRLGDKCTECGHLIVDHVKEWKHSYPAWVCKMVRENELSYACQCGRPYGGR